MDLGCMDMGCVERKGNASAEKGNNPKESVMSASKMGKISKTKDTVRTSLSALNKLASQITKPHHRKTSPINWFPRNKIEPYLKRKLKLLQEVDGMNSTLDETLGDSNPHYSKILIEKIAIKEAAEKAMEARKAAMVEASWCRILQAARIDCKEAEARLLMAENYADEAFEAARDIGVQMSDIPDCVRNRHKRQTLSGGGYASNTALATFETAFEVDKQVAAAVKSAFVKLVNCPSINKDEFKELLRKISENPDTDEAIHHEISEFGSECESDAISELEVGHCKNSCSSNQEAIVDDVSGTRQRLNEKRRDSFKLSYNDLVGLMQDRLGCLKEEELASLATIVATCGLNAALSEEENYKHYTVSSSSDNPCVKAPSRVSFGGRNARSRLSSEAELPSLDKFLVKRLTRLEREVLEAKNARKKEALDGKSKPEGHNNDETLTSVDVLSSRTDQSLKEEDRPVPGLESILVKHASKLEKEVEEARTNDKKFERPATRAKHEVMEVPSLDKFLVKRLTRLEREVQEARNRKTTVSNTNATNPDISFHDNGKENMDMNRIKRRNIGGTDLPRESNYESLDSVLLKHVSRLEREKLAFCAEEQNAGQRQKKNDTNGELENNEGSLDKILVQHKSRLEREKLVIIADQPDDGTIKHSVSRRQAREKELQEAWGGLSLGNSVRPHVSRLERDKATWLKAEEEERKRATTEEACYVKNH